MSGDLLLRPPDILPARGFSFEVRGPVSEASKCFACTDPVLHPWQGRLFLSSSGKVPAQIVFTVERFLGRGAVSKASRCSACTDCLQSFQGRPCLGRPGAVPAQTVVYLFMRHEARAKRHFQNVSPVVMVKHTSSTLTLSLSPFLQPQNLGAVHTTCELSV